jgi:hypothetical protein
MKRRTTMSKFKEDENFDNKMFEDIRELCICCAKSVVVISQRYNQDPRLISKLFLEVYKKINDDLENSR